MRKAIFEINTLKNCTKPSCAKFGLFFQ